MELSKLKYYISQRLLNLTDILVYNGKAPDDKVFPYVVFKFESCNYTVRQRKDWVLTLDFWQDSTDDTDILQAAENIKNGRSVGENDYIGLNNSTQNESEGFYKCEIDFEGEIPDTENDISRYNQRYIVKLD